MKRVAFVFCLVVELVVGFSSFGVSSSSSSTYIENEVQALRAQVDVLVRKYGESNDDLEESVKKFLNKNAEIINLKNEIKDLRAQIEVLRIEQGSNGANGNRLKNEQLTVQWLSNSVTELRSEVSELAQSFNSTVELQQRQILTTDISMLQNDVVSLRHDLESFKAEFVEAGAKMATMAQDIEAHKKLNDNTAALAANLTEKLQVAVSDWSRTMKATDKNRDKVFKRMVVVNEDPLDMKVVTSASGSGRYRRHNKALFKQMLQIKEDIQEMQLTQKQFNYQLLSLEEHVPTVTQSTPPRAMEDLEERLARLETFSRNLNGSVSILNTQMSEQDKLRTSMLELLESVENIENKVDSTTPDLKREISKLEFSLAQITSMTSLIREDQDNQRMSVKALAEGMSSMDGKIMNYQTQVANLSAKLSNSSPPSPSSPSNEKISFELETERNTSAWWRNLISIENTLAKLSVIHSRYTEVINQLPKDCAAVNGTSGVYLTIPDSEIPIVVYCEIKTEPTKEAYTVIQRRINGNEDFNKNWKEYAHGFGDPAGEFWLGNEAIHQLTKNNDTMARIDFKDISGKSWYAEYNEFSVSSSDEGYRLHVAGYAGNASDALEYQNHMQFSTVESDRDISDTNCAANYEGGWWFSHCQHTNLNGKYSLGLTWFDLGRNEWIAVASSEMKIRKRDPK